MPTKAQSPGPSSTTPQATTRKARNVVPASSAAQGRPGSAGGIRLTKEPTNNKSGMDISPASTSKITTSPPAKDTETSSSTVPNRQRRRPRKLNKEPLPSTATPTTPTAAPSVPGNDAAPVASNNELEALKSRVRGLEAKVEKLYKSEGDARSGKSPRRRGKGRKNSTQPLSTTTTAAEEPTKLDEDDEEATEELARLEGELEVARRDLEKYKPNNRARPKTRRSASDETEYVEEITRDGVGVDDRADTADRQVTLTGSYRIPLPSSVSMSDVRNIQSGVNAAQNVARSFLEQRRAQQAVQNPSQPPKAQAPRASGGKQVKVSKDMAIDGSQGQSWSEWFGGYSMAISRAVKNIEADAAIESQRTGLGKSARPHGTRTVSTPTPKKEAG